MENYKKKILEDIQKSGFPAEIDISATLEKGEWMVYNGQLFFDKDESKEREIDVHAVNVDYSLVKKTPTKVGLGGSCKSISHLIIEVKKSDKPIIFFQYGKTRTNFLPKQMFKSDKARFHHLSIENLGTDYGYGNEFFESKENLRSYGLTGHRYLSNPLHKTFYTAFTAPDKPNQIFEAVKKTYKALAYQKERYGTGPYVLHVFTPVIVVDGDLWSVALNKKGGVNLKQVDHLLLEVSQLVPNEKGSRFEEGQIYDVVSRKGFSKFLKTLESDDLSIYTAWSNFIQPKKSKVKKPPLRGGQPV